MWCLVLSFIFTVSYGQIPKPSTDGRQLLHYPPPQVNQQSNLNPYTPLEQQILIYQGGIPGQQPFLLQPGAPPGNFLIPQPQPGFVLRDVPQNPYYPGVQPKPAFTPPINKDAEEIPTNPAAIPPFRSQDIKPEKLETFDEKPETVQPDINTNEENYPKNALPLPGLRPGQRFFILNGQPIFSNFPLHPSLINQPSPYQPGRFYYQPQQSPAEFSKVPPPQFTYHQVPIEDFLLRNGVTGEISDVRHNYVPPDFSQNFISLNQPEVNYRQNLFRYGFPTSPPTKLIKSTPAPSNDEKKDRLKPIVVPDKESSDPNYFRYQSEKEEDDTVVIDAKYDNDDKDSEVVHAQSEDNKEPSISQAQPGAIALAGPGGVASAGPRATSLVGDGGLAVSSPQATAVAGPRDEDKKNKKKPK